MSHGRNGKVEAERDCVNFSKISWVINDKMELGLGTLSYPGGCATPFQSLGFLPRSQDEDEPAGRASVLTALWQRLGH